MAALPYVLGRRRGDLANLVSCSIRAGQSPNDQDKIFAATRLDEQHVNEIANGRFAHCTFANIGFKRVTLKNCNFEDCVFVACYFRGGVWQSCRFQACRFIDCQFTGIQIMGSSFFYSRFSECFIPYGRISLCLPNEPNLRRDLAHNLAIEAAKLGFAEEAAKFRWCEIEANERVLSLAFGGDGDWYRAHYSGYPSRIRAGVQLAASRVNRWLWGYGERVRVLVRNLAILALVIFPILFYLLGSVFGELHKQKGDLYFSDYLYFSIQHMLEPVVSSGVISNGWAAGVAGLEGFVGIIAAGLLVSYLFQWILRR